MDIIRPALRQAEDFELIEKNPFRKINAKKKLKRAPTEEKRGESFTKDELDAFFKVVREQKSPLEKIFQLTLLLGLRRSEVLGLQWNHIDFESATVQICGNVQKINGKLIIETAKNKTVMSKATYSTPDELIKLLKSIKADIEKHQKMFGEQYDYTHQDFVCVDPLGTIFNPDFLSNHIKLLAKKQGLAKRIGFHSLRHTAGTFVYRKNNDLYEAMRFLRHTDIRTTQIYLHADEQIISGSVETMTELISLDEEADD